MFITGADAIEEVLTWKDYEKVFKLCEFIAVTRPGYDKHTLEQNIARFVQQYDCKISLVDVPAMDISSTQIRKRIKGGNSIKYYVPEPVEEYIYRNKLYS